MLGAVARATPPFEVILCNIPDHPAAALPDHPGTVFDFGTTDRFDRPSISPDGRTWAITAHLYSGDGFDHAVIAGSRFTRSTVARSGFPAPFAPDENWGPFRVRVGLDNAGRIALSTRTTAIDSRNEYIVVRDGPKWTVVAREFDPVGPIEGARHGSDLTSVDILSSGALAFRSAGMYDVPTELDTAWIVGESVTLRTGVDIPAGQEVPEGATPAPWLALDSGRIWTDVSGEHYAAQGCLNTVDEAFDQVAVVDGVVVAQESVPLLQNRFADPVFRIGATLMTRRGDWFVRGSNTDGTDWVIRNGDIIAYSGSEVTPGSRVYFSDVYYEDTFFLHVGNAAGDTVIGGTILTTDPRRSSVLVLNGERILAQRGDPVDLDADGVDDDNAFIRNFNNDDAVLSLSTLYFTADLCNASDEPIGQAFMRLPIRPTCPGDTDEDGVVDSNDFFGFLDAFLAGTADFDNNSVVNSSDFFAFVGVFLAGC